MLPRQGLLAQEGEKDYPAGYLSQFKPDLNDLVMEQLSGGTTWLPKAFLADLAPFSMRGLVMGLYDAAFHAGQAFGATALGLVAAGAGFRNMYLASATVIGLLLVLTPLLAGKRIGFSP